MTYKLIKEENYSISVHLKFQHNKYYPRIRYLKDRKSYIKQLKYKFDTIQDFENSQLLKSLRNNNDILKMYFKEDETIIENKAIIKNISFGYLFSGVKRRCKKHNLECDISIDYLKLLYTLNKNCAISNTPLKFKNKFLNSVSVDRKDSSKGYIKENVQLVCKGINFMKNTHSDLEAINFLNLIKNGNNTI